MTKLLSCVLSLTFLATTACSSTGGEGVPDDADVGPRDAVADGNRDPADGALPDAVRPDGETCQPSVEISSPEVVPCGYAGGAPYYTFWNGCNSCYCRAGEDGSVGFACTLASCDSGLPNTTFCEIHYPIPVGTQYGPSLYCDRNGRLFDLTCSRLPTDADGGALTCTFGHMDQVCGIDATGPYFGFYSASVCQSCVCAVGGDGGVANVCTGDFLPGCPDAGSGSVDAGAADAGIDPGAPFCLLPSSSGRLDAGQTSGEWFCDASGKLRLVACMGP